MLEKTVILPPTVPRRKFAKVFRDDIITLLFIGSGYIPEQFYLKGGPTVLEMFKIIRKSYDNVELIIRSDVPSWVIKEYGNDPRIKIFPGILPREELCKLYERADILLLPSHNSPTSVLLEAMSFELPIITTDVDMNPERVSQGETGLLIRVPERLRRAAGSIAHVKEMTIVDEAQVQELAETTSYLIANPTLRRRMGYSARMEVETGKFSMENLNRLLGKVLDEASAGHAR
ncbi:MAG TPA: glycosyltransferase family 4 protein [Nitrososphaerales archaeon]|nr:glycosyltransferase family 4 protein [Nitrososphaerales archaeon]